MTGTSYVAVFRSSGGPAPSAIANWVAAHEDMSVKGLSFSLEPVLRRNAREKLESALGVKSIRARFEGVPDSNGSDINRAAAEAGKVVGKDDYANVSVEINVTMGRLSVLGPATDGIRKALKDLLNNAVLDQFGDGPAGRVKKLIAKTIQPRDNGGTASEDIDFFAQRLTVVTDFGDTSDDALTPEMILSGMMEAIREFRQQTGEYRI